MFGCLCKLLFAWPFNQMMNHQNPYLHTQQVPVFHPINQQPSAGLWPSPNQRFGLKLNPMQHSQQASSFLNPLAEPQLLNSQLLQSPQFIPIPYAENAPPTYDDLLELERQDQLKKLTAAIKARKQQLANQQSSSNDQISKSQPPPQHDRDYNDNYANYQEDVREISYDRKYENKFDDQKPKRTQIDDYDQPKRNNNYEPPIEHRERDRNAPSDYDSKTTKYSPDNKSASIRQSQSDYQPPLEHQRNPDLEVRKSDPLQSDRHSITERPATNGRHTPNNELPIDPTKRPLEVKRQTMTSPSGHLTYITEMLYEANPFKPTPNPTVFPTTNFMGQSTGGELYAPTHDPRLQQAMNHNLANHYGTHYVPPLTGNPMDTSLWSTPVTLGSMPTPPTPYKDHKLDHDRRHPPPSQQQSSSSSPPPPAKKYSRPNTSRDNKLADSSSSIRSTLSRASAADEGLGATAIAGIVIGSLVSVALLAGTKYAALLDKFEDYRFP